MAQILCGMNGDDINSRTFISISLFCSLFFYSEVDFISRQVLLISHQSTATQIQFIYYYWLHKIWNIWRSILYQYISWLLFVLCSCMSSFLTSSAFLLFFSVNERAEGQGGMEESSSLMLHRVWEWIFFLLLSVFRMKSSRAFRACSFLKKETGLQVLPLCLRNSQNTLPNFPKAF